MYVGTIVARIKADCTTTATSRINGVAVFEWLAAAYCWLVVVVVVFVLVLSTHFAD